jgi:hypothetical protein
MTRAYEVIQHRNDVVVLGGGKRLKTLSCPFSRVPDAKFHPVFSVPGDG